MNIHKMKLHEFVTIPGRLRHPFEIIRVPGGWVYRFWEPRQIYLSDGRWRSEDYEYNSVFVPYNEEFKGGNDEWRK